MPSLLEDLEKPPSLEGLRVGIGALSANDSVIRLSADDAERYLFDVEVFTTPESLVDALAQGKIDAATRGTLSAAATVNALKDRFAIDHVQRVAYMRTAYEKPFFLAPVGVGDCRTFEQKVELLQLVDRYSKLFGLTARIAVLGGARLEDMGIDPEVDKTIEDARRLVTRAQELGLSARFYEILIEDAIKTCNLIICPDATSGNLVFRALYYLGSGDCYGAPVLNAKGHIFIDTSRGKTDYTSALKLAAVLGHRRRKFREDVGTPAPGPRPTTGPGRA